MSWLDSAELEALEKITNIKSLDENESVRQVEEHIDQQYLRIQSDAIRAFEKFQTQSEVVCRKLDEIHGEYSKVENNLKERMREMMEVTQAMDLISQRQESLETIQQNLEKLDAELQRRIDIR